MRAGMVIFGFLSLASGLTGLFMPDYFSWQMFVVCIIVGIVMLIIAEPITRCPTCGRYFNHDKEPHLREAEACNYVGNYEGIEYHLKLAKWKDKKS